MAPGDRVDLAGRPVSVVALVPGSVPLLAELRLAPDGSATAPFSTDIVAAAVSAASPAEPRHGAIRFGVDAWSTPGSGPAESAGLTISARERGLHLSTGSGPDLAAVPAKLLLATRSTPTHTVAIPGLGPGEAAEVELAADRAFGDRPAFVPSDVRCRVLLAYLAGGQDAVAASLAARLAAVLGEQRTIAWAEPSFAQLLIGYAHATNGNGVAALTAWCRRTRAGRSLGADGLVLAAQAAWQ